jgi:hypothetical protein
MCWKEKIQWQCYPQASERACVTFSFSPLNLLKAIDIVRDSSAVRHLFVRLAGAVGHQSALHKENSGFAAPTLGWHISTFRGYQILFSKEKIQWQCYPQASERACVTFSPSHFGQGKIIYANHLPWYIAVIVVFWKSRDKWLKKKLTWRNDDN